MTVYTRLRFDKTATGYEVGLDCGGSVQKFGEFRNVGEKWICVPEDLAESLTNWGKREQVEQTFLKIAAGDQLDTYEPIVARAGTQVMSD